MHCLVMILGTVLSASAPQGTPPANVLLIYVDNVGYGDLGCYGNASVQTPRIDQLAREGGRCTDFYVVASSCTPSRGAMLTGRYPARNGLAHQLSPAENFRGIGLPQRERIIPQYLKPAGYATACFGKWNIGFAPGSRPTERGFDEFLGFRSGNIHYFKYTYGDNPIFIARPSRSRAKATARTCLPTPPPTSSAATPSTDGSFICRSTRRTT